MLPKVKVFTEPTKYGWEHYTGQALDPSHAGLEIVSHTPYDMVAGYCSCGHWIGEVSTWGPVSPAEIRFAIREAHRKHADA